MESAQDASPTATAPRQTVPIAQLHSQLVETDSAVVKGVITITWPFSIISRSIAFILAEHDFLLRRDRGQVRVEFHGAPAKAVEKLGLGGGDSVELSLAGVSWEKASTPMRLAGTPLDWQLKFDKTLKLSVTRAETNQTETIDVSGPSNDEDENGEQTTLEIPAIDTDSPQGLEAQLHTPNPKEPHVSKRLASDTFQDDDAYASPAFIKRARMSYGALFEGEFDPFENEEPPSRKRKRKSKARFSMGHSGWKYSSRSPSPPQEQVSDGESAAASEDNHAEMDNGSRPVDSTPSISLGGHNELVLETNGEGHAQTDPVSGDFPSFLMLPVNGHDSSGDSNIVTQHGTAWSQRVDVAAASDQPQELALGLSAEGAQALNTILDTGAQSTLLSSGMETTTFTVPQAASQPQHTDESMLPQQVVPDAFGYMATPDAYLAPATRHTWDQDAQIKSTTQYGDHGSKNSPVHLLESSSPQAVEEASAFSEEGGTEVQPGGVDSKEGMALKDDTTELGWPRSTSREASVASRGEHEYEDGGNIPGEDYDLRVYDRAQDDDDDGSEEGQSVLEDQHSDKYYNEEDEDEEDIDAYDDEDEAVSADDVSEGYSDEVDDSAESYRAHSSIRPVQSEPAVIDLISDSEDEAVPSQPTVSAPSAPLSTDLEPLSKEDTTLQDAVSESEHEDHKAKDGVSDEKVMGDEDEKKDAKDEVDVDEASWSEVDNDSVESRRKAVEKDSNDDSDAEEESNRHEDASGDELLEEIPTTVAQEEEKTAMATPERLPTEGPDTVMEVEKEETAQDPNDQDDLVDQTMADVSQAPEEAASVAEGPETVEHDGGEASQTFNDISQTSGEADGTTSAVPEAPVEFAASGERPETVEEEATEEEEEEEATETADKTQGPASSPTQNTFDTAREAMPDDQTQPTQNQSRSPDPQPYISQLDSAQDMDGESGREVEEETSSPRTLRQLQPPASIRRQNEFKEPDISITLSSLRSRGHRKSQSADSSNADPSRDLAREMATPSEGRSPVNIRVTRHSTRDASDPSLYLTEGGPAVVSSEQSPTFVRETRSMSRSVRQSQTPDAAAALPSQQQHVQQTQTTDRQATPSVAGSSLAEDENMTTLKLQLVKTLRSSLPESIALRSLRSSLNKTVDVAAVVTKTPGAPNRPKNGPRDFMLELFLTDPSTAPSTISVGHIFRPHKTSLPTVQAGDVLLLRRFQVVAMRGRGFGLRTGDGSAWAVFEKGDEEMLPQIKGPPVEVSQEEVTYAEGLRRWWNLLDDVALRKVDRANEKVSRAGK